MTAADVPARGIVALAASAFVVLAAEPLFLLVDTAVVGHLGSTQLAGLGAAGTLMTLLALIGSSLEYGTTGRAARYFGAGRRDAAVNEGVQASWLAVLIGAVAIVVGELVAVPVTRLIVGTNGTVLTAAVEWLRIAILGLPGILLIVAGNGWLRGVQDTRTPVAIVVAANVLSAVASPVLVYPLGLGIRGSAIANVLAQWVGGSLCVLALRREYVARRPQWPVIRAQLLVSRDLVVRSAAFQASYMTAAGVAGRMGAAQLAAHQVGLQLWELVALLLDSFAIAAMSLIGASLGGGDIVAARSTAWRSTRYGFAAGVVLGAVVAGGWWLIPQAFTSSHDVQHQAHLLWPWLVAMMPVGGVLFALDGVLLGAGDNAYIRTVTVLAAVVGYIPITLCALHFGWGIGGVWAGLASFIGLRLVGMVWRTRGSAWLVVGVAPSAS